MCHFQVPLATGTCWRTLTHVQAHKRHCPGIIRQTFLFMHFFSPNSIYLQEFAKKKYRFVLKFSAVFLNFFNPVRPFIAPLFLSLSGSEHSQQNQGEEKGT